MAGGASSVDSLNDIVRDGAVRLAPTRRSLRLPRPSGRVGVVVGLVLLLGVGLTTSTWRAHLFGGDPGGIVLRELSPVAGAVPSGSTVVYSSKNDAVWSPACPDSGGRAGWSGVEVLTTFKTMDASQTVVDAVGTSLAAQGWTPTRPVDDAAWQFIPVAEWTKTLLGTTSAKVVVFQYPQNGSPSPGTPGSAWMLGAEGKTSGYALPGC